MLKVEHPLGFHSWAGILLSMSAFLARLLAYLSRCFLKGRETHLRGKKWASVILPQKLHKSPEVLSSMPLLKSQTTGPCLGCPWYVNGIQRSDMKRTSLSLIYFVHFPRISSLLLQSMSPISTSNPPCSPKHCFHFLFSSRHAHTTFSFSNVPYFDLANIHCLGL